MAWAWCARGVTRNQSLGGVLHEQALHGGASASRRQFVFDEQSIPCSCSSAMPGCLAEEYRSGEASCRRRRASTVVNAKRHVDEPKTVVMLA